MNNFLEEFKKRKRNQILASIIAVITVLVFIYAYAVQKTESEISIASIVVLAVIVAVFIGVAIFSFRNWRCPKCNKYLGKSLSPKFCPHCGEKLI